MNILRVANIPDNRTGGMARWMYSTGDLLASMGHRVDYLFEPGIGKTRSRFVGRFLTPYRVGALVAEMHSRQGPYDVVEVHEPISMWCGIRHRWGNRFPPIIVMSHGLEARSYQSTIEYKKLRGLPLSLKGRISPLAVVWQAFTGLRLASAVLCLNNEDRDHLIAQGIPRDRIHLIPIGVSDAFFRAGKTTLTTDRAGRFLFLGGWFERKGILDLVPAATSILARFPNARLTVAGCIVPSEVILDAFAPDIRRKIDVIPKVASDDSLIQIYSRHQVLLLPSTFEGMPAVMLEAAALKLAIVTTPRCGMKDFIKDGDNGLLVPPGDPDRLISAMTRLLTEPGLAERLGESAHKSAQLYSWENAAMSLYDGYKDAASSRSAHDRRSESSRLKSGL